MVVAGAAQGPALADGGRRLLTGANVWRLLRSGAGDPSWNLAVDEALLVGDDDRPVLRLYDWVPAGLSLGRFQPLEPFLDVAREADVSVVRRPTGGGAIHHTDELTFCLVARPGADAYPAGVEDAYREVHAAVARALAACGASLRPRGGGAPRSVHPRAATLCFEDTTAFDLVDEAGRKVVGSAQRRRDGRVLHHGSIPLSVPRLSPGAGSVADAAGRRVAWDELADALVESFAEAWSLVLEPDELSGNERAQAEFLRRDRYADLRHRAS